MRREPHVRFCERAVVKFRSATHLVILCRKGKTEEASQRLCEIMGKLKLTVNEEKTRICKVPEESSTSWATRSGKCIRREPATVSLCTSRPAQCG